MYICLANYVRGVTYLLLSFFCASSLAFERFEQVQEQLDLIEDPSRKLNFLLEKNSALDTFNDQDKGNYFYRLGFWQIENAKFDDALVSLNRAIDFKKREPLDITYIDALIERSYVLYINTNDFDIYCPDRALAVELARKLAVPEMLARSLGQYAFCFQGRENFTQALKILDEALQITKDESLPESGLSVIHNATGLVYQRNSMFDKAYEHVYKAWEIWDREGDAYDAFNMLHNLVDYASSLEQYDLAKEHVAKMLEMSIQHPEYPDFIFFAAFNEGLVAYRQADYQQAAVSLERALSHEDKTNESYFVANTQILLSESLIEIKQFDKAKALIENIDPSVLSRTVSKTRISALKDFKQNDASRISSYLLNLDRLWRQKFAQFIAQKRLLQLDEHDTKIAAFENQILAQKLAISELELAHETAKTRITTLSFLLGVAVIAFLLLVIIQQTKSKKRFKSRSETDYLTGIANRAHVMEQGKLLVNKANAKSQAFSLILFDLDNFKQINDTFGHDSGDTVIQTVSKVTSQHLRDSDLLGRIGGEEFLILLPGLTNSEALNVANRVKVEIANTDIIVAGASIKCSVSLGVSSLQTQENLSQLVSNADKALYEAKRLGKNTAVSL
jgi:diguanylate cyclase (GGDEF)-like protein